MASNEQIDNTSYYRLPCGLYLEDFIDYKELDFKWGCAVKYKFRAGKKDGESESKDLSKCYHYVNEIAAREGVDHYCAYLKVCEYVDEAMNWQPSEYLKDHFGEYSTSWRPDNNQKGKK